MTDRTAVAASHQATPGLQERHVRRVVDAAEDSHSASTRRNYAAAWQRFSLWADREGVNAIPAMPETVAAYLAERAGGGLSPASLRMAIRYRHAEAGHANPADSEGVRRVLRGLIRRAAREGPRAEASRRAYRQRVGCDPRYRQSAPNRTGRPNRAGQHRAPPWPGGRSPGLGHAGCHAPALRGRRAHMGRRGVAERRVRQGHRAPLEERPGRQWGHPVRWQGCRDGASGDPRPGRFPRRPLSSACVPAGPCRTGSAQQRGRLGW